MTYRLRDPALRDPALRDRRGSGVNLGADIPSALPCVCYALQLSSSPYGLLCLS